MDVGAVFLLAICAVHESLVGTERKWRDVRHESVFRGLAEVVFQGCEDRFDPTETWSLASF